MSSPIRQTLNLARYPAAILSAFLASYGAFFTIVPLAVVLGKVGLYVVFTLVGFAGVCAGTFCLQRHADRLQYQYDPKGRDGYDHFSDNSDREHQECKIFPLFKSWLEL